MSAGDPANSPPERASLADWLAVAAGALGALMATLDVSIVNSSLPTIQGEIGASGTEGTWISTAYLVAEIIIIPLSSWLEKVLGLRTLLIVATTTFTGFSVVCGLSDSLPMMILGRAGQGFTGGALIPTAMTIVGARLPRSQQAVGNSLFGMTIILGPVAGPVVGGWLTENVSWHYAFFINVPICAALLTLLLVGLPHQKPNLDRFREADWLGIAGMAFGLGSLTVVLEEGEREQWFSSPTIIWLSIVSVIGFALIAAGQMTARKPVIRMSLLRDRQFGSVVAIVTIVGMAIYGTAYVIPQFLTTIAGYNALQSGEAVLMSGVPALLMMPFTPWMIRTIDLRVSVLIGLLVLAFSAWLETDITSQSNGAVFATSQFLRGVGTMFSMMFLNQASVRSVPREVAGDAAGLYNGARNLGGSLALAGVAVIQDQRLWLHSRRIEESLSANAVSVQDYMAGQSQALGGSQAAFQSLGNTIQIQALTMTYIDLFWILTIGILMTTPLVFFLRPIPKGAGMAAAH